MDTAANRRIWAHALACVMGGEEFRPADAFKTVSIGKVVAKAEEERKSREAEEEKVRTAPAAAVCPAAPVAALPAPQSAPESAAGAATRPESGCGRPDSIFLSKTANEWLKEASATPDPVRLWGEFWNEGELCCLFADSNAGKSILAVQMACHIARGRKVLYFDFEMSRKQFQRRYSDEQGVPYAFPDNFIRLEMNPNYYSDEEDVENTILEHIRREIIAQGAPVAIIDNLGFICTQSEKGDAAGRLMRRLKEIQSETSVSMLVIGHTPKRDMTAPLTQNELAGSKRLFNFFDSVFAIGQSARDPGLRYLKQLKVRASEFTYTGEHVLTCEIVKADSFIRFERRKTEPESSHLQRPTAERAEEMEQRVMALHQQGKSMRQIADELSLSVSKVFRTLKRQQQRQSA